MPIAIDAANNIAQVLTESLPYIQRFHGTTMVFKYGGNALGDEAVRRSFARDMVLLRAVGIKPIVVHGGGPQISSLLARIGKKTEFLHGLRVTDRETMEVVEMVLGGSVNKDIVNLINSQGGKAVGLTGKDGSLIRAKRLSMASNNGTADNDVIDVGFVGDVDSIDASLVEVLDAAGFIPVIAPIRVGSDGQTYNINADSVAGNLAATLNAEKLMLLTDTTGVLDADDCLIPRLTTAEVQQLIEDGTIHGGMLPKVRCAIDAVAGGTRTTQIIDGRITHAVLLEIFTDQGMGTLIAPTEA